ncbi:hypothetical protein GCM10023332_16270 [Luteimonas vadosa]|uniref:Uncharacterized protein n=1 Tax=Luteimonas vadosa TaxID=1165507 RepID=A0ABP9E3I9_9GAMM
MRGRRRPAWPAIRGKSVLPSDRTHEVFQGLHCTAFGRCFFVYRETAGNAGKPRDWATSASKLPSEYPDDPGQLPRIVEP